MDAEAGEGETNTGKNMAKKAAEVDKRVGKTN